MCIMIKSARCGETEVTASPTKDGWNLTVDLRVIFVEIKQTDLKVGPCVCLYECVCS